MNLSDEKERNFISLSLLKTMLKFWVLQNAWLRLQCITRKSSLLWAHQTSLSVQRYIQPKKEAFPINSSLFRSLLQNEFSSWICCSKGAAILSNRWHINKMIDLFTFSCYFLLNICMCGFSPCVSLSLSLPSCILSSDTSVTFLLLFRWTILLFKDGITFMFISFLSSFLTHFGLGSPSSFEPLNFAW